jgi:hypothetical protein
MTSKLTLFAITNTIRISDIRLIAMGFDKCSMVERQSYELLRHIIGMRTRGNFRKGARQ